MSTVTIVVSGNDHLQRIAGLALLEDVELRLRDPLAVANRSSPLAGRRFLEDNLTEARVTKDDVRAKLREANVLNLESVQR